MIVAASPRERGLLAADHQAIEPGRLDLPAHVLGRRLVRERAGADAVDDVTLAQIGGLYAELQVAEQIGMGAPHARPLLARAVLRLHQSELDEISPGRERLSGRRVLAFAGIGRPEKFFATLEDLGAEVVETRSFPDHHPYRAQEIESLRARAAELDALPVTTEKDAVRIEPDLRAGLEVLAVAVEWRDPEALQTLLEPISAAAAQASAQARHTARSP